MIGRIKQNLFPSCKSLIFCFLITMLKLTVMWHYGCWEVRALLKLCNDAICYEADLITKPFMNYYSYECLLSDTLYLEFERNLHKIKIVHKERRCNVITCFEFFVNLSPLGIPIGRMFFFFEFLRTYTILHFLKCIIHFH